MINISVSVSELVILIADISVIGISVYLLIGAPLLLYKLHNPHGTPTCKTKVLRLVSNVQLVKQLLWCNKRQIQRYLALLWQ